MKRRLYTTSMDLYSIIEIDFIVSNRDVGWVDYPTADRIDAAIGHEPTLDYYQLAALRRLRKEDRFRNAPVCLMAYPIPIQRLDLDGFIH